MLGKLIQVEGDWTLTEEQREELKIWRSTILTEAEEMLNLVKHKHEEESKAIEELEKTKNADRNNNKTVAHNVRHTGNFADDNFHTDVWDSD